MIRLPEIQTLFRIPFPGTSGIAIRWYGVMLLAGFLCGMILARRLAKRERVRPDTIYDLALWALLAGLIGARLWYVVEFARVFYDEPVRSAADLLRQVGRTLNFTDGGLVYYGGLVAPVIVLWWWFRRHKLPVLKMFDIIAPAAMLGLAFGRVGCLFNGCCFGKECSPQFPLAFERPREGATWDYQVRYAHLDPKTDWSKPVYPVQLMSSVDAALLCLVLLWLYRKKKRDGDIVAALLLLYPPVRFVEELLRSHEEASWLGLISIAQLVSIGGVLLGVVLVVRRKKRPLAAAYAPSEAAPAPAPRAPAKGPPPPKNRPPRRKRRN